MTDSRIGNQWAATWPDSHAEFVRANFSQMSMGRMAKALNKEYGTSYSRNAVCGKVSRMGLGEKPAPAITTSQRRPGRRKAAPAPAVTPEPLIPAADTIVPRNLSLLELGPNECRWPYGVGPFVFCGHDGYPYCPAHSVLSRRAAYGRVACAVVEGASNRGEVG
jgi:GcrA cell cycle regulator